MFSLQTIFGKGDKYYGLLEAGAGAARESTSALVELLQAPAGQRSLDKVFKLGLLAATQNVGAGSPAISTYRDSRTYRHSRLTGAPTGKYLR